ncbi:hypothetical protein ACSLO3_27725, partial [Escherichia coli]
RYDLRYGHPINANKRHVMIPKENGSWLCLIDLEHALRVAGIRSLQLIQPSGVTGELPDSSFNL